MQSMKNKILETAIPLFVGEGFEKVTMNDIARALGCNCADVYSYFNSKNAILEAVYARYGEIIHAKRLSEEAYLQVLRTGTAEDILNIFNYSLPEPLYINFDVIRIVTARRNSDERALKIYLEKWWEGQEHLTEVLTAGVKMGRLVMNSEDLESFRHFVQSSREYSVNMATMMPDRAEWRRIETGMNRYLASLLVLNDPITSEVEITPPQTYRDAAFWKMIDCESKAVGRYYHYATRLKRMGRTKWASFVNEIIENLLDELDALYGCVEESENLLDAEVMLQRIKESEAFKCQSADMNAGFSDVLTQISELSLQHVQMCERYLQTKNGVAG